MDAAGIELADLDGLSVAKLKALLCDQHAQLLSHREQLVVKDEQIRFYTFEIEALKLQILKLRHMQFGKGSEKRALDIEQLQLLVENLETAAAERSCELDQKTAAKPAPSVPKPRREFAAHLPRETQTIAPHQSCCPDCGGELKHLGEDVCEMLELEPVRFKVIRHARPKLACASCDTIVQAPAPTRPIERGMAGPGLLAHVIVGKYADHLPLYRQAEIFAREGVELNRTRACSCRRRRARSLTRYAQSSQGHLSHAAGGRAEHRCPCFTAHRLEPSSARIAATSRRIWGVWTNDTRSCVPSLRLKSSSLG